MLYFLSNLRMAWFSRQDRKSCRKLLMDEIGVWSANWRAASVGRPSTLWFLQNPHHGHRGNWKLAACVYEEKWLHHQECIHLKSHTCFDSLLFLS